MDKAVFDIMGKMIAGNKDDIHEINHFLKVYAFAHLIGVEEGLDINTQKTLEIAAIIHDIACPLCKEKYGNADGKHQEEEGMPMAAEFLKDLDIPQSMKERIVYLVGHHHTYGMIDGADYQILLEADFLVNAGESEEYRKKIDVFRTKVFKTSAGIKLLDKMYPHSN